MKNKLYFSENPQNKRKRYVHVCNIIMENSLRNVDYQFIFSADMLTMKPRLNCVYIQKNLTILKYGITIPIVRYMYCFQFFMI